MGGGGTRAGQAEVGGQSKGEKHKKVLQLLFRQPQKTRTNIQQNQFTKLEAYKSRKESANLKRKKKIQQDNQASNIMNLFSINKSQHWQKRNCPEPYYRGGHTGNRTWEHNSLGARCVREGPGPRQVKINKYPSLRRCSFVTHEYIKS